MSSKQKRATKKEKSFPSPLLTPIHLTCIAILVILLASLNVIVYLSPPKTVVVHAKDETPIVQVYYLKALLKDNPTYREGWVQLAKMEYLMGNIEECKKAIIKVKELDPNYEGLDSLQLLLTNK
jgi:hypothetical protein